MFFKEQRIHKKIVKMELESLAFEQAKIVKEQNRKENLYVNFYGRKIKMKNFFIANVTFMLILIFIHFLK